SQGQHAWRAPGTGQLVSMRTGNGKLVAKNTGVTVVSDFCSADLAAGGRGAPLAPLLHQELFYTDREDRAVVNIGGIASLTLLPARGGVSGFDCGPGICLMDVWTMRHLQKTRDVAGSWAAKGKVCKQLLQSMLQDPYFDSMLPASTGPEYFNITWLDNFLAEHALDATDVQTTLAELTVISIARCLASGPLPKRLLVCGGGAHNTHLLGRLAAALPQAVVDTTNRYGADPDWVEGLLFAWLAHERLAGRVQDTTTITGASHPSLLGRIFEP
ncbi:MAG: anhydro-N-acetylmuramic acid kinase, partial [Xanthomonadales bacterium]|nr:anhydro-N-acetylmuramic acid kinase [Xanthomonadales bacterium]